MNEYRHLSELTNREIECLQLTANGNTYAETAALMNISPATVRCYRRTIIDKFSCRTIAAAVAIAIKQGIF
jgi:DNA-binding CsgD family transcriptional regulator